MLDRPKALAFDLDPDSLMSLRRAFPGWEVQARYEVTPGSLSQDWDPGEVDLMVVGARDQEAETLRLCRGLRGQAGRAETPLLVLLPTGAEAQSMEALEAGANSCLVLPVQPRQLQDMVARARAGNRPGHHTHSLDRAQRADEWRDHGGEA